MSALLMVSVGRMIGGAASRSMHVGHDRAILIMGFMVVNAAFALPFVETVYGAAGVARLAAFDAVNNALVMTWVYAVAARANPEASHRPRRAFRFVLCTPPIYAVACRPPAQCHRHDDSRWFAGSVDVFAAASPLLISVGTGLLFLPRRHPAGRALDVAMARPVAGLCVATMLALALGLDGVDRGVLLLLGAAPMGFVLVTFASLERLDAELAAQCLTLSLLTAFLLSTGLALASV